MPNQPSLPCARTREEARAGVTSERARPQRHTSQSTAKVARAIRSRARAPRGSPSASCDGTAHAAPSGDQDSPSAMAGRASDDDRRPRVIPMMIGPARISGMSTSSPLASLNRRPPDRPLETEVTARETTMQVAAPSAPVISATRATPGRRSQASDVASEASVVAAPATPTTALSSIPSMSGRSAMG